MFFSNVANTLLAIQAMESITPHECRGERQRRDWDDDMAVGSVHVIETLELLLALRKIGWDQVILLDQFPFREDPVTAARESIRTIRQLDALLDRLDLQALVPLADQVLSYPPFRGRLMCPASFGSLE